MKRFKDLNPTQKKTVVDRLYRESLRDIRWNGAGETDAVKERLKEITTKIQFCGCGACEYKLGMEISKDSVIKEAQLEKAMKNAETAYYPDDQDIVIKV